MPVKSGVYRPLDPLRRPASVTMAHALVLSTPQPVLLRERGKGSWRGASCVACPRRLPPCRDAQAPAETCCARAGWRSRPRTLCAAAACSPRCSSLFVRGRFNRYGCGGGGRKPKEGTTEKESRKHEAGRRGDAGSERMTGRGVRQPRYTAPIRRHTVATRGPHRCQAPAPCKV